MLSHSYQGQNHHQQAQAGRLDLGGSSVGFISLTSHASLCAFSAQLIEFVFHLMYLFFDTFSSYSNWKITLYSKLFHITSNSWYPYKPRCTGISERFSPLHHSFAKYLNCRNFRMERFSVTCVKNHLSPYCQKEAPNLCPVSEDLSEALLPRLAFLLQFYHASHKMIFKLYQKKECCESLKSHFCVE